MAYSRATYIADGNTAQFSIPFSYLDQAFIKVYINDVDISTTSYTYSYSTTNTIVISPKPPNGTKVSIRRSTNLTDRLVDFQDPSILNEADLDKSADQLFHLIQEQNDLTNSEVYDDVLASCSGYVTNAQTAQAAAVTAQTNAQTSAQAAATSVTQAASQATLASQWANTDENVEVTTGQYSAKHWALKSQEASGATILNLVNSMLSAWNPKNYLINGKFDICQRGTSNSSSSALIFVADHWFGQGSGSTLAQSQQQFTLGQTLVPNEPAYFLRNVVTSSAGAANRAWAGQKIESVRSCAGSTVTLSFYAKADAAKNIAVEFSQVFGTGGSPSAQVTNIGTTKLALTTTWAKYTVTVSVPSISGKTLGTNNDDCLTLTFWFDAGSNYASRTNTLGQQSGTFDIALVQLESGSSATNFEVRPLGMELLLCQRYFEKSYDLAVAPGTSTTNGCDMYLVPMSISTGYPVRTTAFTTEKRAIPTVTIYSTNGTSGKMLNLTQSINKTATAGSIGAKAFRPTHNDSTPSLSGDYLLWHWTADAEL